MRKLALHLAITGLIALAWSLGCGKEGSSLSQPRGPAKSAEQLIEDLKSSDPGAVEQAAMDLSALPADQVQKALPALKDAATKHKQPRVQGMIQRAIRAAQPRR